MSKSLLRIFFSGISYILMASAGRAQPLSIALEPGTEPLIVTGASGYLAPSFTQPLHGTLTVERLDLRYVPVTSFWTIGVDQITYTPFGISALPVHVFLIAQDRGTVQFAASFETSIEVPPDFQIAAPFGRSVALTSEAASEGALGLSISLGTGSVFAQFDPGGPGGYSHGSGGQTGVDPPWPPGGGSTLMGTVGWRQMSFGNGAELELRMRTAEDGYEV